MDGTILDNVKAHVRATEAILRDLGRRDIDPREFHAKWDEAMFPFHSHVERAHRFLSISHIMSRCLGQTLKQHMIAFDERSLDKYVMITRKSFIKYGRLFDDTRPALKSLKNLGYSLSIISNADLDVYRQLARLRLSSFFARGVTSYEARSYKPLRRIFAKALRATRSKPEEAVMVGDSLEYDIAGASRVGMTTILIDRRSGCDSRRTVAAHVQPDYIIRDLREIGIILSCLDGVRK